jgi:hypothetical protein
MLLKNGFRVLLSFVVGLMLLSGSALYAQKDKDKDKKDEQEIVNAEVVLWREPTDITSQDLFLGPGGTALKPDLTNVTFVKEDPGGYSIKWHVLDAANRKWIVKLGKEARTETTAVRLVWAVGYVTEINYLVACVHIKGAPKPRHKVDRCESDGFADARFEARPEDVKRLDEWAWKGNPFVGKKELNGLVVLMALLNNWDLKTSNNKVLQVTGVDGRIERQYVISDLGATFGKTGGFISHNRNRPDQYVKTKFVEGVERGSVRFAYKGKQGELLDNVSVADARWIGSLLAQLSDQQLEDAFRAGNFTPEEIQILTQAVKTRINQLVTLPD